MIRVLFVDDEPELLKIARTFVEREKEFTVDTAGSTKEADELRKKTEYDCLVVDYQMADEDGIEYLKRIRAASDRIAYILFTGHGREDVAIDALNNGADFYLKKGGEPKVKFAELRNMVKTAVSRNRALDEAARLALTVEASPDAIISTDLEGNFRTWNPGAERIYGAKASEVIGRNAAAFFPEEKLEEFRTILDKMKMGQPFGPLQTTRKRKDGTRVFTLATYYPLRDLNGKVMGASGIIRDVTPQIIAEERLKATQQDFKTLVQSAPCIICRLSPDGETLFVNDFVETVTGFAASEVLGKNWWDLFYPGPLKEQVESLTNQILKHDVFGAEMVLEDKRGGHRTVLWTSFNRYDKESGDLLEVNGIGLDVTMTRMAEEGLRESGLFNRAVLDSLEAHIAVVDRGGKIVAVNDAWERFARKNSTDHAGRFGYGANYLEVTRRAIAAGAEGAKEALEGIKDVMNGKLDSFSMEYECSVPERAMWFHMRVTPLSRRRGGVVVSHADITDSKLMQEALRMSEQRYRTIFETTGTAMVMLAKDGTVLLMNAELERLSDYSKIEVEGKMNWRSFVAPKDLPRVAEYNRKRMADPSSAPRSYEFEAVARNGTRRSMLATADVIPGTPNVLVSLIDVTEGKSNVEKIRVANKKLAMLGSMTRHDIFNQLTVVYGTLEQAAAAETEERRAAALTRANEASLKIQRLLEFSRDYQEAGTNEPVWVDLDEKIRRSMDHFVGSGLDISCSVGRYQVLVDQMAEKVFYNLIDNAIRHGEKATSVRFRSQEGQDGLNVICEDDGVGVPEKDKERIFERGVGKNTGYGLYLVREILAITGLSIRETGVEGEGARFEILFPVETYRMSS